MYIFEKDKLKDDIKVIENEKNNVLNKSSEIFKDSKDDDEIEYLVDIIDNNLKVMYEQFKESKNKNILKKDKLWVHRTSENSIKCILKEGFRISNEPGRFGRGVYFSSNEKYTFSKEPYISAIINTDILSLWHSDICNMFESENIEPEEGGSYSLEKYAKENGYKAVEIKYITEVSELVVYDTNVIKIANITY